jgi:hypothetical protein
MDDRQHWEKDSWDDHPATGDAKFGASVRIAVPMPVAKAMAAANPTGGWAQTLGVAPKLTFLQKLASFIVHPIKTIQGKAPAQMPASQSTMAGLPSHNATLASEFDQPSFFGASGSSWWESRIGDTGRDSWDETK